MTTAPGKPFDCIECLGPADQSLKCEIRDGEHAYLHLPACNDNQGRADEIEGDMA